MKYQYPFFAGAMRNAHIFSATPATDDGQLITRENRIPKNIKGHRRRNNFRRIPLTDL